MIETVISVFGLICAITLFVFRMIEEKSVDNRKKEIERVRSEILNERYNRRCFAYLCRTSFRCTCGNYCRYYRRSGTLACSYLGCR